MIAGGTQMASVRKLTRDRSKKGAPYYIQFLDHEGRRRTTRGCPDKGVTEAKAAKIETAVQRIKIGLADQSELDDLLGKPQSDAWGEQIKAFEASLKRKNNTLKHVSLTVNRVKLVLTGSEFKSLSDFDADEVEEFLTQHCQEEDLGHRTYNHYLQAVDSFGNWLSHPKRRILEKNPFSGIPRRNAETDVRHARRALSPTEIALVIQTAQTSSYKVQGYDGVTRARIYLLSYMTGLRKGEIASLTRANFKLDGEQPTLTVEAKHSKHRKKDILPLHVDLVAEVKIWLAGLEVNQPLFPLLEKRKAYKMIQRDLEEAEIPYETEEGLADFHAAGRHTHITELLRCGVSLVEAKELARHSDVRMTMKYTHIGLEDQAKAVNRLPALSKVEPPASATPTEECLHIVCTSSGAAGQNGATPVTHRHSNGRAKKRQNPRRGKGLDADSQPLSQVDPNCQKVEAAVRLWNFSSLVSDPGKCPFGLSFGRIGRDSDGFRAVCHLGLRL
jgi:integrase